MKKTRIPVLEIYLVILVLIGIYFRFNGQDWNQGTNLHPDEYGLTNTLTQLKMPASLADYFNTRVSPLSPYMKYDINGKETVNGPDNRMRWGQWPMIILRAAAERTGNTQYDDLRLMGRALSAIADLLVLLLIYAIGRRLYDHQIGLLAAALSGLAVMQIQQAHFMTVDPYGVLFCTLAMYAAVRVAQAPGALRLEVTYRPNLGVLGWYLLFGVAFGMALASKINLLPLGGMVLVAALISIADLKLRSRQDLWRLLAIYAGFLLLSALAALITFRLVQPMSFRAPSGDTGLLTLHLNPDWVESMKVASSESTGIGGGPPAEQWSRRPAIIFPLVNMLLWGMGLPLGLAVWAGVFAAGWRLVRYGENWKAHLLPLVWTLGYFLFMGTRWVTSIRYFLPIYPFLCLFAAWGLLTWWRAARPGAESAVQGVSQAARRILPGLAFLVVVLGTLAWAYAFTQAVYRTPHTRLQAARWMFANVPGPFHLTIQGSDGTQTSQPVPAPEGLLVTAFTPYTQAFTAAATGQLGQVLLPHVSAPGADGSLHLTISSDAQAAEILGETDVPIRSAGVGSGAGPAEGSFQGVALEKGRTYYLTASTTGEQVANIWHTVVANEDWDEGLPPRLDGWDPFGELYTGTTMNVRWADDENKRKMFLDVLNQTDYIILPSQRGIWSTCRLPLTYPMTIAYYRALFAGQLGFEPVGKFDAPMQIGPLNVSDVGGTFALGQPAQLPLFNHNLLAAEEAFSVYDHPPVWIFKKGPNFSLQAAADLLNGIDLGKVIVQSPRYATGPICQ